MDRVQRIGGLFVLSTGLVHHTQPIIAVMYLPIAHSAVVRTTVARRASKPDLVGKGSLNTGLRDQELCGLKWNWEQRVPELDSPGIQHSVSILPAVKNKNRQARVVVLNERAQAIVEKMRGQHPVYVFTWVNENGVRRRVGRIRNTGWVNARRRAADRYPRVLIVRSKDSQA